MLIYLNSYTFHINLYDLAFLGAIFIGLTFALLLWFTKTVNRSANRFLALALVTMILWMIRILAIDLELETYLPHWDWLPMQFLLALGPLMYLYVLKITGPQYKFGLKDLAHFVPVLFEQGIFGLEIRESANTGAPTYLTYTFQQLNPVLQLLIFISILSYLYKSHKVIQNFYRQLQPVLMDRPLVEFRWLRRLLSATALLWVLWIVYAAVDYFGYRNQSGIQVYYPFYIFFVVIIIWTAAAAFLKPQAASMAQTTALYRSPVPVELKAKGAWLKRAMEVKQYYQEPELSLSSLAGRLNMPPHELSRVINTALKKNFNDFINEYRVIDAARKMQDPAYDHITLLGIAFESGFNSKTSFNRIFKQMTGKSPTEYKIHLENKRPTYNLERYPRPGLLILNREPRQMWVPEKFNSKYMFRNYLKIGWRNLIKNKVYSGINVLGLTAGMAVAMLVGLWIWDELSFNKEFKNYEHIGQVMQNQTFNGEVQTWSGVPMPLGPELNKIDGSDFKYIVRSGWTGEHKVVSGQKKFKKSGNYMEPGVTEMLSLKMKKGSRAGLNEMNSILLSASTAKAIFGDTDPLGKVLTIDDKAVIKVTGVYEDISYNSSFADLGFIAPWDLFVKTQEFDKILQNSWGASWFQTFVQTNDNIDINTVSKKIRDAKKNTMSKEEAAKIKPEIFVHPMNKWHLYSEFKEGVAAGGRILYVWLFGIIGVFVLLLACINFMNLSTALSEKRAKEVGIRKAIGSLRQQLIYQFFTESLTITVFAFVCSLILVQLALPFFNNLTDKHIQILWTNPIFWLVSICFCVTTGLIAGSYPAFYLSSFKPVKVLKGVFRAGRNAAIPRKVLVVLQFTVSVILIIGTVVVFRQVQYTRNRPIGYNNNNLLTINSGKIYDHFQSFRNDLLQTGSVTEVAGSELEVTNTFITNSGFDWKGKDPSMQEEFVTLGITPEFGKTTGWQIVDGRDFSKEFVSDSSAIVLNEEAAKYLGFQHPVGETILWGKNERMHIIGVVKNMVTQNPYDPIKQTFFYLRKGYLGTINIKINPAVSAKTALTAIEAVYKKYNAEDPFEYRFADEQYARKFNNEQRIGKLASLFTILAIFISCLGLFGLTAFVAEQRKKEIGVRKVLGASTYNLWEMISKDFALLVIIACVIAIPLAWYYSHNWLKQYNYRTTISVWIFVASGAGSLAITLITVSFQAIRAALANPVKSLRTE